MGTLNRDAGRTVAFPFYIFISLLLGIMGVVAVRDVWLGAERGLAVLTFVLFFSHIGLFWMNFLPGNRGRRASVFRDSRFRLPRFPFVR